MSGPATYDNGGLDYGKAFYIRSIGGNVKMPCRFPIPRARSLRHSIQNVAALSRTLLSWVCILLERAGPPCPARAPQYRRPLKHPNNHLVFAGIKPCDPTHPSSRRCSLQIPVFGKMGRRAILPWPLVQCSTLPERSRTGKHMQVRQDATGRSRTSRIRSRGTTVVSRIPRSAFSTAAWRGSQLTLSQHASIWFRTIFYSWFVRLFNLLPVGSGWCLARFSATGISRQQSLTSADRLALRLDQISGSWLL